MVSSELEHGWHSELKSDGRDTRDIERRVWRISWDHGSGVCSPLSGKGSYPSSTLRVESSRADCPIRRASTRIHWPGGMAILRIVDRELVQAQSEVESFQLQTGRGERLPCSISPIRRAERGGHCSW